MILTCSTLLNDIICKFSTCHLRSIMRAVYFLANIWQMKDPDISNVTFSSMHTMLQASEHNSTQGWALAGKHEIKRKSQETRPSNTKVGATWGTLWTWLGFHLLYEKVGKIEHGKLKERVQKGKVGCSRKSPEYLSCVTSSLMYPCDRKQGRVLGFGKCVVCSARQENRDNCT